MASLDLMEIEAFTPYKREYQKRAKKYVCGIYDGTEYKDDNVGIESVARIATELAAIDVNHFKGESKFKQETRMLGLRAGYALDLMAARPEGDF